MRSRLFPSSRSLLSSSSRLTACRGTGLAHRALSTSNNAWENAISAYERDSTFTTETLAALNEAMPPTRVSITQLSMAARQATPQQRLLNAVFIHAELVARRAAMLQQFHQMPPELANTAGVRELSDMYGQRLINLLRGPRPRTADDESAFAAKMSQLQPVQLGETRKALGAALDEMAIAREGQPLPCGLQAVVDRHIDRIFLSRVGIRFLVKHYLASREPADGFMGIIQEECCPVSLCEATAASVSSQLRERFGAAPPIEVVVGSRTETFMFVPEHIKFVVGELLRNSSRATLRWHAKTTGRGADGAPLTSDDEASLPAVRVVVTVSGASVNIKVADVAGGLPRSRLADVWSYHAPRLQGGIGMGLPLARLYAMYFGGSLQLIPMEGYGTDAFATFNRLGDSNSEHSIMAPIVCGGGSFASPQVQDGAAPASSWYRDNLAQQAASG